MFIITICIIRHLTVECISYCLSRGVHFTNVVLTEIYSWNYMNIFTLCVFSIYIYVFTTAHTYLFIIVALLFNEHV